MSLESKICIISRLPTDNKYKNYFIHKEVIDYANWYRDKISTEKKVTTRSVLTMFLEMKKCGYSFSNIQDKLDIELKQKGLLNESEIQQKFIS